MLRVIYVDYKGNEQLSDRRFSGPDEDSHAFEHARELVDSGICRAEIMSTVGGYEKRTVPLKDDAK